MGGTNSKTSDTEKSKLEELEDKVNTIVDDIIKKDGNGYYIFSNKELENYRNLTNNEKNQGYTAK